MGKLTRFQDVDRFTRDGSWECDYTPDRLIKQIDDWVGEEKLNMDPDFQRGHVWTAKQQTAYIEFYLRGGKTARVIYFNNPTWNRDCDDYRDFVIVDGLQRVTAFRTFIENRIKVFGSYYREYTDSFRMGLNTVRLNVNDLKTRAEVLQWYLDFNTGGVVHTDAEIQRVRKLLEAEKVK